MYAKNNPYHGFHEETFPGRDVEGIYRVHCSYLRGLQCWFKRIDLEWILAKHLDTTLEDKKPQSIVIDIVMYRPSALPLKSPIELFP